MVTLGKINDLKILQLTPEGALLEGEVLLPSVELSGKAEPGEQRSVFVQKNAAGRLVATLKRPFAQRGEVAFLKILSANKEGALLTWGLPEPLFLAWKEVKAEQQPEIQPGQRVLVIVFKQEDDRLAASTLLDEFIQDEAEGLHEGDAVALVVHGPTDLGVKVIVNHRFWGLVHHSDCFTTLSRGDARTGYLKALRADKRLNVTLAAPGYAKVDAISQTLLDLLKREGGFIPVTDKSQPEEIYARFGVSKKAFKQTIGTLYKARRIVIEAGGIRLVT